MTELTLTTPETVARAQEILGTHRRELERAGVPGSLTLLGGSSLVGLLTKGDVDLHLRVPADAFPVAVARLLDSYKPANREIWTPAFVTVERPGDPDVGIAVTAIGSEHDARFSRTWAVMRASESARLRYNDIKRRRPGDEVAKSRFFDEVLADADAG